MQANFKEKLEEVLSKEKIDAYRNRRNDSSDEEIYAHFLWNIQLGEALYPSIQALEVALRNRISQSIAKKFNGEFYKMAHKFLYESELPELEKVEAGLKQQGKSPTNGLIIENLRFGFWTSLFDIRYEHRQILWPVLLKSTIPYASKYLRTRKEMSKRLNTIRRLRNRVFHHGSIWHWKDLSDQHKLILETLKWLSPELHDLIIQVDRFQEVFENGYIARMDSLEQVDKNNLTDAGRHRY